MQHACKHDKGEVTHKYQQFIREERTISNTEMRIRLTVKKEPTNVLVWHTHHALVRITSKAPVNLSSNKQCMNCQAYLSMELEI